MLRTRPANTRVGRLLALAFLALVVALALVAAPARATIVLLSTSPGPPASQDANLYDWRGQWTSALDRAAPVPGQLPPLQVNVGLYGDWWQPAGDNIVEQDPTCQIDLQITGAPIIQTVLHPCVGGPPLDELATKPPVPELLTPNLAAAGNGPHTVTITAYNAHGDSNSTSFNVEIDNVLPSPTSMVGAVGWQRGGEMITSTATTDGPSGIAGQYCSIGSAIASWYPGPTAQIPVAGDATIPVRCTAQNDAGVPGSTTEYDALLDNSPPVGYFAPRDPNNPSRASVDVADSLSGVAGGQIQIQTASGWQPLATSYSPGTGQLTAAIPDDGGLPDGNYALRAVASDAVGNTAMITTDQNGTPEVVTEPLRIVTDLRVGRSHALIRPCTVNRVRIRTRRKLRHQRPAARLVRHCSEVAVPRKGASVTLRLHHDATVSGLVQTADGNPVPDAAVLVAEQATGWRIRPVGTLTSDSQGKFTYTIPAGPSRTITFSYAGAGTLRASSATTTVRVIGKAKIKVSRHALAGGRLRITGRVPGGYIPAGGILVQLQYTFRGVPIGWQPFHAPVHIDRHGRWSVTFPVSRAAAGYTYELRALVASQTGWPFLTTLSNTIARGVS